MRKFGAVPGVFAGFVMLLAPAVSSAGVSFSIRIAPPALEIYQQPPCPTDGYLWTPGYWGYRGEGYYWIPGAWVAPPQAGFLWTPGYWGYSGGLYGFNAGYWGPTVGFYGGVNYGFGYGGSGFDGGRWQGGHFAYNTAVSRVNTTVIHNTYNQGAASHGSSRTSFNGGPGGIAARPSAAEMSIAREHNQPSAAPAEQQRASAATPAAHQQARQSNMAAARPAAASAPANNRSAEPANRTATRVTPNATQPNERPAANTRVAPQQSQSAKPEQPRQVASARNTAPSRPAPQQSRPAPQQSRPAPEARPQTHAAAAPEQHAAARPEGKEERK